jgi:hypothetical protein
MHNSINLVCISSHVGLVVGGVLLEEEMGEQEVTAPVHTTLIE